MSAAFAIQDFDRGWAKLVATAKALERGAYSKVGLLDDGKGNDPRGALTNTEIGAIHEYGSGSIPARPWLGAAIDQYRTSEIEPFIHQIVLGLVDGKFSVDRALGLLGAKGTALVKQYINSQPSNWPPLADSTKERKESLTRKGAKGGVKTLIDTGRMLGAINWAVVMGGEK